MASAPIKASTFQVYILSAMPSTLWAATSLVREFCQLLLPRKQVYVFGGAFRDDDLRRTLR
jgi:hypothetical protein